MTSRERRRHQRNGGLQRVLERGREALKTHAEKTGIPNPTRVSEPIQPVVRVEPHPDVAASTASTGGNCNVAISKESLTSEGHLTNLYPGNAVYDQVVHNMTFLERLAFDWRVAYLELVMQLGDRAGPGAGYTDQHPLSSISSLVKNPGPAYMHRYHGQALARMGSAYHTRGFEGWCWHLIVAIVPYDRRLAAVLAHLEAEYAVGDKSAAEKTVEAAKAATGRSTEPVPYHRPASGYGGYQHGYQQPRTRETVKEKMAKSPPPPASETGYPRASDEELLADPNVKELLEMLSYVRPDGGSGTTNGELEFIQRFIVNLPNVTVDKFGNRWVRVTQKVRDLTENGKPVELEPNIMFSCHTDTVHRERGVTKQKLCFGDGRVFAEDSSCLGADDGAGVWLMVQMIKAGVLGLYIFHRAEEVGGKGSSHIVQHHRPKFKDIDACIAFDRKGYDSIITRQGGTRTCSDEFAKSLAALLGGKFTIDTGGTFTDSKNYIDLIGECTNVSVGYFQQHGPMEWLDVGFLVHLRDKLISLDWSKLAIVRKPGERESYGGHGGYGGHRQQGTGRAPPGVPYGYDWWDDYGHYSGPPPATKKSAKTSKPSRPATPASQLPEGLFRDRTSILSEAFGEDMEKFYRMRAADMIAYCHKYPETVAHFLLVHDHSAQDIAAWFKKSPLTGKEDWDMGDGIDFDWEV